MVQNLIKEQEFLEISEIVEEILEKIRISSNVRT